MMMTPCLRKAVLTAHVTASVGWMGAIAAFLPLAIVGLTRRDAQMVRGAYLAMDWIGWFILVPFSLASLVTGLVQSLGTEWGLLRHYWILAKLLINVLANIVLLLFMLRLHAVASGAAAATLVGDTPVVHSIIALLLLLVATTLSVYKPRALTPFGWRKLQERRRLSQRSTQDEQRQMVQR